MVRIVGGGYEATCGNCGSVLEFTRSEVRAGARQPHSYDGEHVAVITCPKKKCGRSVDVTSLVGPVSAEAAGQQERDDLY